MFRHVLITFCPFVRSAFWIGFDFDFGFDTGGRGRRGPRHRGRPPWTDRRSVEADADGCGRGTGERGVMNPLASVSNSVFHLFDLSIFVRCCFLCVPQISYPDDNEDGPTRPPPRTGLDPASASLKLTRAWMTRGCPPPRHAVYQLPTARGCVRVVFPVTPQMRSLSSSPAVRRGG